MAYWTVYGCFLKLIREKSRMVATAIVTTSNFFVSPLFEGLVLDELYVQKAMVGVVIKQNSLKRIMILDK